MGEAATTCRVAPAPGDAPAGLPDRTERAPDPNASRATAGWALRALVLLCLLGAALSVELTRIHLFVHTDPSFHSVCALGEGVNCETVATSPYSVFAGLPVSVWGLAAYLGMGALGLWGSIRRLHPSWPIGLLLTLSTVSLVVSVVLAFISATRIDSLCLFCMASYLVNVGLFALALRAWRQTGTGPWRLLRRDLEAIDRRPTVLAALALPSAALLGSLYAFVPTYWKSPSWAELPTMASGTDAEGHHWIGAERPRLTILEFTDYECPHCRAAHKEVRLLVSKHAAQVRLVHRHLPLDMACHPGLGQPFHHRACLFAEAAECAGRQGRFWAMNDALFSSQETERTEDVDPTELAVRLGLDRSEFVSCLQTHETASRIATDVAVAMERNLVGTPSFLVRDRLLLGRISEAELAELLAAEP